jgi:hypothetical protein
VSIRSDQRRPDIVFPANSCPAHLGVFIRDENDNVSIELTDGETVTINGFTTANSSSLQGDGDGKHKPDVIVYRDLSFYVVPRGHRVGIRLRDRNSEVRAAFTGRVWFDYDPTYCVEADFVAYEPGKTIPILTVLGDVDDTPAPAMCALISPVRVIRSMLSKPAKGSFSISVMPPAAKKLTALGGF